MWRKEDVGGEDGLDDVKCRILMFAIALFDESYDWLGSV
jgi:hypothetical protein